jgi:hypothetical protein
MSKIAFTLFMLSSITCFAGDQKERKSDMQYYQVIEQKPERMPNGQSLIKFTFKEHSGLCLRDQVKSMHNKNKKVFTPQIDTNGNCSHKIKPGKYKFKFWTSFCDTLTTDEIEIKNMHSISILVHLHSNNMMIESDKPVIYLYPSLNTNISLELNYKGNVSFSYPSLKENKWTVNASSDGTLEANGKTYNYLFWDGKMDAGLLKPNLNQGSIVESTNLVEFFETSLAQIGLNSKEAADFITYWVPRMMKNKKNFVQFKLTDAYNEIATLHVIPEPDKQLRIYMIWSNVEENNSISPSPQSFPEFKRDGFTLIEWGGSEIKNLLNNL